ncbi:hypothetical protein AB840_11190 [Megasphaera cerevisiae DSM 20462]|uniref:DUF2612 domain-containing protein n=1 Tax=Megasphaera cerevisiae DSM 20462 TaxID=1122219 RepID=A0A0J6WVJ4_9FIRM|nr:DUF2612 domain-containing protein [Megasphaera cerevisiae]KMO85837.1 hypothetical protein AB840_11190 [Megasphaera cerevisiae DSM 20462]SJZ58416.1 Protein of unknown function [Megasphaera cerevisiae DSM 20462]
MALSDQYKKLITSEHQGKPNFLATLSAFLSPLDDIYDLAVYMDSYFDLDNVVGNQEDTLGVIVQANRTLTFQPDRQADPILDDQDYRNYIKAKIARNMWNGKTQSLYNIWNTIFSNNLIILDNQDMTVDICAIGMSSFIICNMIINDYIIPRPMGVLYNYFFSDNTIFGYDIESDAIKGYDEGYWTSSLPLNSFGYDLESDSERVYGYDNGYWT